MHRLCTQVRMFARRSYVDKREFALYLREVLQRSCPFAAALTQLLPYTMAPWSTRCQLFCWIALTLKAQKERLLARHAAAAAATATATAIATTTSYNYSYSHPHSYSYSYNLLLLLLLLLLPLRRRRRRRRRLLLLLLRRQVRVEVVVRLRLESRQLQQGWQDKKSEVRQPGKSQTRTHHNVIVTATIHDQAQPVVSKL